MQEFGASIVLLLCLCTSVTARPPLPGPFHIAPTGHYKLPGTNCGTYIMHPHELEKGPFPIAVFAHGVGVSSDSNMPWHFCASVVSLGFVVVAPTPWWCEGQDILDALNATKATKSLHKALGYVDWTRTAIFGHSYGGQRVLEVTPEAQLKGLKAVISSHAWGGSHKAPEITIPIMMMSGSWDKWAESTLSDSYQQCPSKYKVFASVEGGRHMEPIGPGRLNPYAAHFLGCHVANMKHSCEKVYGISSDAMCMKVETSTCWKKSNFTFTTTTTTYNGTTTTTTTTSPRIVILREAGGTGCFKSAGGGRLLEVGAADACARFGIFGRLLKSMEVGGQCLDWFGKENAFGLWDCHGGGNQQFEVDGMQWCTNDNRKCAEEVSFDSSTTIGLSSTNSTSSASSATSTTGAIITSTMTRLEPEPEPEPSSTTSSNSTTSSMAATRSTTSTTKELSTSAPTITPSTTYTSTTITTTAASPHFVMLREGGSTGCLKSAGAGRLLEVGAASGCARFEMVGRLLKSVDVEGQCLDVFHEQNAFGLWACHGRGNQQFEVDGVQWCANDNSKCAEEVLPHSSTTRGLSTTSFIASTSSTTSTTGAITTSMMATPEPKTTSGMSITSSMVATSSTTSTTKELSNSATTTPVASPHFISLREAGGTGCLKSAGARHLLEVGAVAGCARFKIVGRLLKSMDVAGQCLDLFRKPNAFGLWSCHDGSNQQFEVDGLQWCTDDNRKCAEQVSPDSSTTGGLSTTSSIWPTTSPTATSMTATTATITVTTTAATTSTTVAATAITITTTTTTTIDINTTSNTTLSTAASSTTMTTTTATADNGLRTKCLKSSGHGQLLTPYGNSNCAEFEIQGKVFRSLGVSGSCLDWFPGRGWGLWHCQGQQNQQLVNRRSGKWCYEGNCITVSGDNVTTITKVKRSVPRWVKEGNYNLPDGYHCSKKSRRGNTAIMYPSDWQNGPFPIASFAHGSGGGVLHKLCAEVVKMGFVVISPLTHNCDGHGWDQVDAISKAKSNPSLHPALAHVDFSRTAIFGHSFGGMHASWMAYREVVPWLNAVVVAHGWFLGGGASWIDIPVMFMSGSHDRQANAAAWPAYHDNKVAPDKVYAAVNGGSHMEPAHEGRLNQYAAHFLACHVREMQSSCDKVYGFGEQSMCNTVDTSACFRSAGPQFLSATDPKAIQNVSSTSNATSCLKSNGHGQVLTEDGSSDCAKFGIQAGTLSRKVFTSMDVSGSCLDWFEGHGWGLYDCHGQKNQQLVSSGSGKWCYNGNCIIVSGDSITRPIDPNTTETATTSTTTTLEPEPQPEPASSTTSGISTTRFLAVTSSTSSATMEVSTSTTTAASPNFVMLREIGGKECFKAPDAKRGSFAQSAHLSCARFERSGEHFKSLDVAGFCLALRKRNSFGLWKCKRRMNQLYKAQGSQWCAKNSRSHKTRCVEEFSHDLPALQAATEYTGPTSTTAAAHRRLADAKEGVKQSLFFFV